MSMDQMATFLGWCTLINSGLLILWGVIFLFGRRWIFSIHSRWFELSEERFNQIHYNGMLFYKIGIILFNLVPYAVLKLLVL